MTDGEPNEENTQLLTVNEVGNSSVRTLPGYQVPEQNSYSIQTKGMVKMRNLSLTFKFKPFWKNIFDKKNIKHNPGKEYVWSINKVLS